MNWTCAAVMSLIFSLGLANHLNQNAPDLFNLRATPGINGSSGGRELLFDGRIPTLIDLEGNFWANKLITIPNSDSEPTELIFDFTVTDINFQEVDLIELVMFNCPEWNIGSDSVVISGASTVAEPRIFTAGSYDIVTTSCEHLVHVCIPAPLGSPVQILTFANIVPGSSPTTTRCFLNLTGLVSSLTVMPAIVAIVITVVFILIQICVCRYHRNFKRGNRHNRQSSQEDAEAVQQVGNSGQNSSSGFHEQRGGEFVTKDSRGALPEIPKEVTGVKRQQKENTQRHVVGVTRQEANIPSQATRPKNNSGTGGPSPAYLKVVSGMPDEATHPAAHSENDALYEDMNELDEDMGGSYVDPREISGPHEVTYMKADGGGDDKEFDLKENDAYSRSGNNFDLTENEAYV